MPTVRSRARTRRAAKPRVRAPRPEQRTNAFNPEARQPTGSDSPGSSRAPDLGRSGPTPPPSLADLGVYGFERHESVILASLVTGDPLLLVGRSGTGKTFLLNTLSEALGLEHRHYNASLISFDDLVGFPYPDDARTTVRFLETPATVWGAQSVLIDEISRCKPEHQNRLFSLVHERRLQGLRLEKLQYRWAAMNPCTSDQGSSEDYAGSEPLDPALADRFTLVVPAPDWAELSTEQRSRVVSPSGEGRVTPRNDALIAQLDAWRAVFAAQADACPAHVAAYVTTAVTALNGAGVRVSPRRARLMARSLLAATIVATRQSAALYRSVLECSLPHATWGQAIEPSTIAAAHRLAWEAACDVGKAWIHGFLAEPALERKLELLLDGCSDPDEGSQAIAQLIANESPARAGAFAFATYPAGLSGGLPIGAEGLNDLAKIAVPLLHAEGELSWQERLGDRESTHPVISEVGKVLVPLEGSRKARARQFLVSCVVRGIQLESPADLEAQIHACVELLRARGLVEAAAVGVEATGLVDAAVVGAAASRGGAVASGAAGLGDAVTGDAAFMGGGVKGGAA